MHQIIFFCVFFYFSSTEYTNFVLQLPLMFVIVRYSKEDDSKSVIYTQYVPKSLASLTGPIAAFIVNTMLGINRFQ